MKNVVLITLALTSMLLFSSCTQSSPSICVPEQSSLEEGDLKGPIKRVKINDNQGSIKILEYNTEGMITLEKYISDSYTRNCIFEYDNLNRIIKETTDYFFIETGKIRNNFVITSYSSNEKISKEYDDDKLISEESTKYEYDSRGRKLSETIGVKKYSENSSRLDTSFIKEQRYFRYEGENLKYEVVYEPSRDSTVIEYDSNGHRVRTEQNNGYKSIVIWSGDIKIKEILYEYGYIWRTCEYDDAGHLIKDSRYGSTDCDIKNHVTSVFKCTYYLDNEYLYQEYREYGRYDYVAHATLDCHLQLTDEYRCKIEKDEYGNIVNEDEYRGSRRRNIKSVQYEYY